MVFNVLVRLFGSCISEDKELRLRLHNIGVATMEREPEIATDVEIDFKLKVRAQWLPVLLLWLVVSVLGSGLVVWLGR